MTVHDKAGYLESQGKILVTNGHSNVIMEFIFEFFSIDTSELQIDSERCPTVSKMISDRVDLKNEQFKSKFENIFAGIQEDHEVQERSPRVVPAVVYPIVTAIGTTLASESVSMFFGLAKNSKMSKKIDLIESEVEQLSAVLKGSICSFTSQSIINRLKITDKIFSDYIAKTESAVERIVFDRKLTLETRVKSCLAANKNLDGETCLEIAKMSHSYNYLIIAVEKIDKGFNIKVLIETPRVTEVVSGNLVYSIGLPKIQNNRKFLVRPKLPDFIPDGGDRWTYNGIRTNKYIQLWDDKLIDRNHGHTSFDEDCLAMNNTDAECDAYFTEVYTNFFVELIFRQQILVSFEECTLRIEGKKSRTLKSGIHVISEIGQLICGSKSIELTKIKMLPITTTFDHHSFGDLNEISSLNLDSIPFWDRDNPVNKISVFGKVKFFTLMIVTWCALIVIVFIGVKIFWSRFQNSYREIRSIAATPY